MVTMTMIIMIIDCLMDGFFAENFQPNLYVHIFYRNTLRLNTYIHYSILPIKNVTTKLIDFKDNLI